MIEPHLLAKIPIDFFQQNLICLHDTLGIPWWATLVFAGATTRAASLPMSLRASTATANYLRARKAVEQATYKLLGDYSLSSCCKDLRSPGRRVTHLTWHYAQRPRSRWWLLGTVAQVPVLVTGTMSIAALAHPGLAYEGCLWFPDLTKAALSYEGAMDVILNPKLYNNAESLALQRAITPMGIYGVILPTAFFLTWHYNLAATMQSLSGFVLSTISRRLAQRNVLGSSALSHAIHRNVGVTRLVSLAAFPALIAVPHSLLLYLLSASGTTWVCSRLQMLLSKNNSTSSTLPVLIAEPPCATKIPHKSPGPSTVLKSGDSTQLSEAQEPATSSTTPSASLHIQNETELDVLLDEVIVNYCRNHKRTALMAAHRAKKLWPENGHVCFAVGQLHRELGEWQSALKSFKQCTSLEPHDNHVHSARIYTALSASYIGLKKPADAVRAATVAIQFQPDEAMNYMARMNAHHRNGNTAAAIKDAEKVAELDQNLGRDLPGVIEKLKTSRR